jgi:L-seryl-tRNA(Ser) seleniumtransferase
LRYPEPVANFRVIPSIDELRQRPRITDLEREYGSVATLAALRHATDTLRQVISKQDGGPADGAEASAQIEADAAATLNGQFKGSLRPAINATGVIVHTNLGRAPLARAAIERLGQIAAGYSNLEYDLHQGARGSRTVHAESLLTTLTGAEAAVVVNNNAAAALLILAGLAAGREVIVSRGELVEIGGGFRVPDVMAQSGAVLREVGTTNRTRISDYRAAISSATALLLRVHRSNFRIEGFTEQPTLQELVATATELQVPLAEDLGSGCLLPSIPDEPTVAESVAAGVDIVCFSGDKLLGGPQAGIIVGKQKLVQRLRAHPLMRALRVDKLTLAALEGTLLEYAAGRARDTVPVLRMIEQTAEMVEQRARALAERLAAARWNVALVSGSSTIGGGSAPGVELPTVLLAIERTGVSASALEEQLRRLDPPVIARIESDRVVLDLRTVLETQDQQLGDLLSAIELGSGAG